RASGTRPRRRSPKCLFRIQKSRRRSFGFSKTKATLLITRLIRKRRILGSRSRTRLPTGRARLLVSSGLAGQGCVVTLERKIFPASSVAWECQFFPHHVVFFLDAKQRNRMW